MQREISRYLGPAAAPFVKSLFNVLVFSGVFVFTGTCLADSYPDTTFDGLVRVKNTRVDAAWIKPGADLSIYNRVMIGLVDVRFKKGWERDHREVSKRDQQRIKKGLADMFGEIFSKELRDGGMQTTSRADDDVLMIRAAIIDLDITAPDVMASGRTRNFVASAGEMAIVGELFDSVSGDLLARVSDKKSASSIKRFTLATRASNSMEARKALGYWAGLLSDRLQEIRESKGADN